MRFAFTMLGTRDVERAVGFYRDVLGLSVSAKFGDFVLFETGATVLALSGELEPASRSERTHEIVFGVASVEATYAELRDRVTFLNEPRPIAGENWAVNFKDPDGHLCSFYGPQ
jgi:catechol 2,3-dioxygenase-like lactoylglutathione lyase family enzyme